MMWDHLVLLLLVVFFAIECEKLNWDDEKGMHQYGYNRYWKIETTVFWFKTMYYTAKNQPCFTSAIFFKSFILNI